MRTTNPSLKEETFDEYSHLAGADASSRMTITGTINKTLILMVLALTSALVTWTVVAAKGAEAGFPWMIGGVIGGLILAVIIVFKPTVAPTLAPVYALVEGCALGAISAVLNQAYPGIAIQAVAITFGVTFSMLIAYQSRVIRATETFKKVVISATLGIAFVYLISLGMSLFGARMPYLHDATPLGIGISVVILIVAAMNLVLDFDMIENGAERGAPKFMEWYAGFSLLVTLVWIYIEALRLLRKLRG